MMPDLDDAFRAFQADTLAQVRPAGLAEARGRSRRRRRRQVTAVAVPALLAVVLPLATYAAAPRSSPLGGRPGLSALPSASGLPSWVPGSPLPPWESEPPPATPGLFCPFDPSLSPDSAATMDQLCAGTIDVPPWPADLGKRCVSGPLTFTDGAYWNGSYVITFGPEYGAPILSADVDGDGVAETVVVIVCNVMDAGQTVAAQVVVLKPGTGGRFTTLGRVVLANEIFQVAVTGTGTIQVNVGQWYTFAWNGTGFAEVTGAPDPAVLTSEPSGPPSSGG